jgi:ferredoxin
MAHHAALSGYRRLARRLNRHPQGAPPSDLLFAILKHLFSEREASLVSLLPIKLFDAGNAARAWDMRPSEARTILDHLCSRALLVDVHTKGRVLYCLPPPMAGFFEFSMMRVRPDIDQKALADLLYRYINLEEDFAQALFARGATQLGRVFVDEPYIPESFQAEVLDYERASHVIAAAGRIGLSQCYCRHKMRHVGKACNAPLEICLTLHHAASALIEHGHARAIDSTEALDLLQRARDLHLVQFGENVREQINFICNCCKCCCEGMIAARRFALFHPVQTTRFLPDVDPAHCSGCGLCVKHCPVEALSLTKDAQDKKAVLDASVCLGCGVCARTCPHQAIHLQLRLPSQRTVTPLNTAHRVVLMALERGNLSEVLFDNQVFFSHRALAVFLGVFLKLPPVQQLLACRQVKSHFLESLVRRMHWQPAGNPSITP